MKRKYDNILGTMSTKLTFFFLKKLILLTV